MVAGLKNWSPKNLHVQPQVTVRSSILTSLCLGQVFSLGLHCEQVILCDRNLILADTVTVSQTALPHQVRPACGSQEKAAGASADGIHANQTKQLEVKLEVSQCSVCFATYIIVANEPKASVPN